MIPLSAALTACGEPTPIVLTPPASLLSCADEPQAPDLPERDGTNETQIARDTLTLDYLLGLRSAWGDCKSKVEGVKAWSDEVSE